MLFLLQYTLDVCFLTTQDSLTPSHHWDNVVLRLWQQSGSQAFQIIALQSNSNSHVAALPGLGKMVQPINCNYIQLSWALQQMHRCLHPAGSTSSGILLPLVLLGLRSWLHLWCLSVPSCKMEAFILLCKGVEMLALLLDGGKHKFAHIHIYARYAYIYTLSI